MRAEGAPDVAKFIGLAYAHLISYELIGFPNVPDCEFRFTSRLSLIDLLRILETIPDGHVMFATLSLACEYTGERINLIT